MKLDVGCGNRPSGDVNVDLYVRDVFNHRNLNCDVLDVKRIGNFVCCDGRRLPFRDGCFDEVFCGQVVEHFADPVGFLRELVRVSCGLVVVETVHRYGERLDGNKKWYDEHHLSKFNVRWFARCAVLLGCVQLESYVVDYRFFPNSALRLFWVPFQFGVRWKKVFK